MRFLKITPAARPGDDSAAAMRLSNIVGRGQAELSIHGYRASTPELEGERRFWTPDELNAANADG